jgi:hypothetical protein
MLRQLAQTCTFQMFAEFHNPALSTYKRTLMCLV